MKITEFLSKEAVTNDLKATSKIEVIQELVDILIDSKVIEKKYRIKIVDILLAREALGSTAIGQGIAIPHGKSDCTDQLVAAIGISKKGINFDSLDGDPAHIFFLLVAPADSAGPHLKALARVSRLLKDKFFRDSLKNTKTPKEMLELISREDMRVD